MAIWQRVSGLKDGQEVAADTFNRPIGELVSRTEYLKELMERLNAADPRGTILVEASLSDTDTPVVGDVVCIDPTTRKYIKAVASMSLYDAYTASEKAFALGVLTAKENLNGYVALYGKIRLNFKTANLVDRGEFVTGQYYLSSTVPGKITRFPSGPRVLVGFFVKSEQKTGDHQGIEAFINPQHMDIESHAHRTYTLLARPCGTGRTVYDGQDSNDSADLGDSNDAPGRVVVEGYLPEVVDGDGAGIPRMVVCGDWTAGFAEYYEVKVSNGVANYNDPATSWPVDVEWRKSGSNESGSGQLRFFGDSVAVGRFGLRIKLEPSEGMAEDTPFGRTDLSDEQRTWKIDRFSGRGWSKAGADTVSDLGAGLVRFGGVSNRFMSHVVVHIPPGVYDLTSEIASISEGDTLSVDGTSYKFTKNPDSNSDTDIQILDNTVYGDTFDTLAQLCGVESGAVYHEGLRQVLLGASEVVFNGSPVRALLSGQTSFAMVSYDDGESLAPPILLDSSARYFTLVQTDPWKVTPLENGLDMMVIQGDLSVGDKATADIYCVPGAKYRYNIEFDNDLKLHFPPVPARSGCLMLNGVEMESYENYGDKAVIAIGDDSIYWRDDTEGRQPWPIPDMSQSDQVDPEDEYRELFHFVSEFHSETGPVTSLHPAEGSPITRRRCGTDEDATVGDLELDVDLTLGMSDQGVPGYKVPKASRGGKLLLGPVVERLVAGPGISLSKTSGAPDGQGVVTITADGSEYAGDFETLALENAKLESIGMFPYIRLLKWDPDSDSNIPTGFVAKFHVPATALDGVYRVKFYASVFGEASFSGNAYQTAGVRMDYNILPDYTGTGADMIETANLRTGLIAPDESFVLDIPFGSTDGDGNTSYTAYDPILIHNDSSIEDIRGRSVRVMDHAFPTEDECQGYIRNNLGNVAGVFGIRPGYTVAVRFSRTSPSNGEPYVGSIGFLNLRWSIEEVTTIKATSSEKVDDIVAQTVRNLRRAAAKSGPMDTGYAIVNVLTRIVNALK